MANKYLDLYKSSERSKLEKQAFDVLVTDLMVKNLTGAEKSQELTAQNMEQKMTSNFVPTMFYIFMYVKQDPETFMNLPFYDACPLIFCTSVDVKSVTGINFNLIPNNVRASFLDVLSNDYQEFYKNMDETSPDAMVLNQNLGTLITSEKGLSTLLQYFKAKSGFDLTSCVRKYNRSNIQKTRMIEYDQWSYIPFLTFSDSVRGTSLAILQSEFISKQH